jgi:phosphate transport system substrate-binding protein
MPAMRLAFSCLMLFLAASAGAAEKLVIKGSNTFGETLGPRLIQEFTRLHPGLTVELESKGSATGFAALAAGACDIAAASRAASEDELRLAQSRGLRLNHYVIGYYGVAVIVNAVNPVAKLSDAQVRELFTGAAGQWTAVGGPDLPVHPYIRDPVSGTYLGFQELALDRRPYAASARPLQSYAEIAGAVAQDRGGIGYVGMDLTKWPGVKPVAINGVLPSALAIEDGRYPYARALRFYTNAARESAVAKQFIRFVLSRRGQQILEQHGDVPRAERRLWSPTEPW